MPTDYSKEFARYQDRFARLVGPDLVVGQYGAYRERLVLRLDEAQFGAKVDQYMALGKAFTDMVNAGDTIDDTVAVDLRAIEVELVMEKSLFLPDFRS